MNRSWHLSWPAWLGLLGLGLALWLIVTYASLIQEVIGILFGAFLLSLAIRPLADALARWRIPRGVTVLGVYIGFIGSLVVLGALLVPIIDAEITLLRTKGPDLLQTALSRLTATPFLNRLVPFGDTLTQNLIQGLYTLGPTFLSTVAGAGAIALDLVVVLILAYFLATDTTIGKHLAHSLIPGPYHVRAFIVMARVHDRLARWMWAQVAIALYFALTFGLGLAWLGIPFALTIALIGGVLEIIPYVGGVVAVLLGILSALTVDPVLVWWVIALHVIVAEVQSHIVAPTFYGRAIHLHPALVLIALLVGFKAKGIVGVLFAVPVVVVLLTLLQEIRATSLAATKALSDQPDTGAAPQLQGQAKSTPSAAGID